MDHDDDIERLIVAAHAVTRIAALETRNEAPAAQWRTLVILRDEGSLRIGELAHRSRVTQPGMTRLIAQLEQDGLLAREADANDSRVSLVSITDAGLDAVDVWMAQLVRSLRTHFGDLSSEEWAALSLTADVLARTTRIPELAR